MLSMCARIALRSAARSSWMLAVETRVVKVAKRAAPSMKEQTEKPKILRIIDSHFLIVYPQISPSTRFGITTDLLVIYSSASRKETQKQSCSLCATHRAKNLLDLRSQGFHRLRSCGSLWRPTISALRMQIGFKTGKK